MNKTLKQLGITMITASVIGLVLIVTSFGAGLVAGALARCFRLGWQLVN